LRECDRFHGLLKGSDSPQHGWAIDQSLQRALEVDLGVGLICKTHGHGKAWVEHGGDCIKKLGFVPTEVWDFAGWTKRQVARQDDIRNLNEEQVCRQMIMNQHKHDTSTDKFQAKSVTWRVGKPKAARAPGLARMVLIRNAEALGQKQERVACQGGQVSQ
jgi:hypothetical protein